MEMNSRIRVLLQSGMILVVRILVLIWIGPFILNQTQNKRIEHTITDIQVLDIDEPWVGHLDLTNYDRYNAKTYFGAFYPQDRIIFEE